MLSTVATSRDPTPGVSDGQVRGSGIGLAYGCATAGHAHPVWLRPPKGHLSHSPEPPAPGEQKPSAPPRSRGPALPPPRRPPSVTPRSWSPLCQTTGPGRAAACTGDVVSPLRLRYQNASDGAAGDPRARTSHRPAAWRPRRRRPQRPRLARAASHSLCPLCPHYGGPGGAGVCARALILSWGLHAP